MTHFKTGDVVEFTENYMAEYEHGAARIGDRAIVVRSEFGSASTLVSLRLAKNGRGTTVYETRLRRREDGHLFDIGDRITGEARYPDAFRIGSGPEILTGVVTGYRVGALNVTTEERVQNRHILASTAVLVEAKKEEEKIVTEIKRALVGPKPKPVPPVHPFVQTPLDTRDGDEDVFDADGVLVFSINAAPFDDYQDRYNFARFVAEAVNEKVARDSAEPDLYVLNASNKATEPPAHVKKFHNDSSDWDLVRFGTGWWFLDKSAGDSLPRGRDNGWAWGGGMMISNYDLPMTEVRS